MSGQSSPSRVFVNFLRKCRARWRNSTVGCTGPASCLPTPSCLPLAAWVRGRLRARPASQAPSKPPPALIFSDDLHPSDVTALKSGCAGPASAAAPPPPPGPFSKDISERTSSPHNSPHRHTASKQNAKYQEVTRYRVESRDPDETRHVEQRAARNNMIQHEHEILYVGPYV